MISFYYAHLFENHESKYEKKPTIYFGDKLLKDYIRLELKLDIDDYDFRGICLFALAKYQFIF